MASLSSLRYASTEQKRALLFLTWILFVTLKQARDSYRMNVAEVESGNDQEVEETVKVHGANIKFTQTKGGYLRFGFFNAMEFWLPIVIRVYDILNLFKYGTKMFRKFPAYVQLTQLSFGIFVLTPLLETILPEDWSNPTKEQQKSQKKSDPTYKLPLFFWTVLEIYTTFLNLKMITGSKSHKLGRVNRFFLLLATAFFNGAIGITVSHELIHKNRTLDKFAGSLLLCNVNYMHWGEEHLTGHHEAVATPEDPATAELNESLYHFFPKTLIGSFKSSWRLEMNRLQLKDEKEGKAVSSVWVRPDNRMLWNIALPFCYANVIAKTVGGGWKTVLAFYVQGFFAASMLEVINYVEHYGLRREKLADGKYEAVDPTHSWNSPHRLSNAVLFKLQRHSDHHTYAMRPYQLLRNFKESPQLPTGYPGMYILAWFPSIFKWIMNPLVEAHARNKARLSILATDPNSEYSYSKSDELIEVEKTARDRLRKFLVGVAVVHALVIKGLLQRESVMY